MPDEASDSDLLRRFVTQGTDEAFTQLVRRHIGLVYRTALRRVAGDVHTAEDIAQSVFALLARKAPRLMNHSSLAGWLHTTTRYVARDAIRAAARRRANEQEAQAMNDVEGVEGSPGWDRLRPIIDEALGELNERDREAVLLRYFAGLPFADIASKLGIAENAARMRVDRAVEKLGDRLRRHGIESTGAALSAALANEAVGMPVPANLAADVAASVLTTGGTVSAALGGAAVLLSAGKLILFASIAMITASAGLLSYGVYARNDARDQLEQAEQRARAADGRSQASARELAALDQHLQRLRAAVAKADADAAMSAAAVEPQAQSTEWDPRAEGAAFMRRHPEVKTALSDWTQARARFQYSSLLAQLRLSPEQADRFVDLLTARMTISMPFGRGGRQLAFEVDSASHASTFGTELTALLGADGIAQFQRFQKTQQAREDVTKLASSLAFSELPMTAGQAESLIAAYSSHTTTVKGRPIPVIDWPALTTDAQAILNPTQWTSFLTLRDEVMNRDRREIVTSASGSGGSKSSSRP